MKLVNRIARKVSSISNRILDDLRPFIRKRKYFGFTLYYSRGTSLVERLNKKDSIYEPMTSLFIINELKHKKNPLMIDVGANIGLISLFVARNIDYVRIFAFEPGPHQNLLFSKTIKENKLESVIYLSDLALSKSEGYFDFYTHKSKDVSGDGFVDTKRAGDTNKIKIQTIKLDNWWNENSKPMIDLIKIDTEGAELWVLEGAEIFIKECRPIIVTEMNSQNYINYPYTVFDVFDKLIKYRYKIYTEDKKLVSINNLENFQTLGIDSYLCIPD